MPTEMNAWVDCEEREPSERAEVPADYPPGSSTGQFSGTSGNNEWYGDYEETGVSHMDELTKAMEAWEFPSEGYLPGTEWAPEPHDTEGRFSYSSNYVTKPANYDTRCVCDRSRVLCLFRVPPPEGSEN